MTLDFSPETMDFRQRWNNNFQWWKKRTDDSESYTQQNYLSKIFLVDLDNAVSNLYWQAKKLK